MTFQETLADMLHTQKHVNTNIVNSIADTIGNTPLVRLSNIRALFGLETDILAKLESANPGGSSKDRPALAMLNALMNSERFNDNTEVVEASSGNSGVALACLCASFGIKLTVCMPEHMSIERRLMMKHYGANVVLTPKAEGIAGAMAMADKLTQACEHRIGLDQFSNLANSAAHATTTAKEILRDTGGDLDAFITGVGTGGTLSGIAHTFRHADCKAKIIAVEPTSCATLSKGEKGSHAIQGISIGHIPALLNIDDIDSVVTVSDNDAITMAREFAKHEGIAIGISSGAALAAAVALSKTCAYRGKRIVVMFADSAERYFSTALFEQ